MGLIAGREAYACCLSVGRSGNGPDTSKAYIKFAVPNESMDGGRDILDSITNSPGGFSFGDQTGTNKDGVQIQRCIVDKRVQSSAMAELNAITNALDEWTALGSSPIYFFWVLNSVNKTYTDSDGNHNQYFKCGLKRYRYKPININEFDFTFILAKRDI